MKDLLDGYALTSLVDTPARFQSILDYVITNNPSNIINISNFDAGISDHFGLLFSCKLNLDFNKNATASKQTFPRSINNISISEFLSRFVLSFEAVVGDLDVVFENFFEPFRWCFEVTVPLKSRLLSKSEKIHCSEELCEELTRLERINWVKNNSNDDIIQHLYKNHKRELKKNYQRKASILSK